MDKKITVTISDVDDTKKLYSALRLLFESLVEYYKKNDDIVNLKTFAITCSLYFGNLLTELGYDKLEDIEEDLFSDE